MQEAFAGSHELQGPGLSDRQIQALLLGGNEDGVRALLRKHGGRIRSHLLRKFGAHRTADVDDAMSVALQSVWFNIQRFDPDKTEIGSWFFVIARNALITALRTRKTADLVVSLQVEPVDAIARTGAMERSQAQEALLQALAACIEALGPVQHEIIMADLATGGSAGGEALAKQCKRSANAVYVARNRAHTKLRKCLAKKGYEGKK